MAPSEPPPVSGKRSRKSLGSPATWARQFPRDVECERAARELIPVYGADTGWEYLKACIEKGNFNLLEALCSAWSDDLKNRPEAAPLIAQIVANRGAHLRGDIQMLQQRRVPLFELGAAMANTSAFKGRYILFVAKLAETKKARGKLELVLTEQALGSEATDIIQGGYGSTGTSSDQGRGSWRSSGALGSGSAEGESSRRSFSKSGDVEIRVTDFFEETGQEVIARIKGPDPFLPPTDKNLVFLVRFDGALVGDLEGYDGEQPKRTALVTLVSYHDI